MSAIYDVLRALKMSEMDPNKQIWATLAHLANITKQTNPKSTLTSGKIEFIAENGVDGVCFARKDSLPKHSFIVGGDLPSVSDYVIAPKPDKCPMLGKCDASKCPFKEQVK